MTANNPLANLLRNISRSYYQKKIKGFEETQVSLKRQKKEAILKTKEYKKKLHQTEKELRDLQKAGAPYVDLPPRGLRTFFHRKKG